MTQEETHTGGCACGALRYRVHGAPLFVHCCHCSLCQRQNGSAFAVNALIESDRIECLQGSVDRVEVPSSSGKGQVIVRCAQCQVAAWSHYLVGGDKLAFLRVGTLDEPSVMPPDIHIHTASKQAWVELPEGLPSVQEYYDAREYWPKESLARYVAMKAGS